jgi:hypothetical protein
MLDSLSHTSTSLISKIALLRPHLEAEIRVFFFPGVGDQTEGLPKVLLIYILNPKDFS